MDIGLKADLVRALVPGTIWILKACTTEHANQVYTVNKVHWPIFLLMESLYVLIVLKLFLLSTPVLQ